MLKQFHHSNSPNIHTSLAVVNLRKLIDSGAIHLIGSLPLDAERGIFYNIIIVPYNQLNMDQSLTSFN